MKKVSLEQLSLPSPTWASPDFVQSVFNWLKPTRYVGCLSVRLPSEEWSNRPVPVFYDGRPDINAPIRYFYAVPSQNEQFRFSPHPALGIDDIVWRAVYDDNRKQYMISNHYNAWRENNRGEYVSGGPIGEESNTSTFKRLRIVEGEWYVEE